MLSLLRVTLPPEDRSVPLVEYAFNVWHNVGALPTTIDADLILQQHLQTGKVSGQLTLSGLEASSLDEARMKLSVWCARMSVALSNVERTPGDFPKYEKRSFDLAKQPSWVRAEFERLAPRFAACAAADAAEEPRAILSEMVAEGNPLIFISGAYDFLELKAYPDE